MYSDNYSDHYSKTSGRLWQYCKDILAIDNNGNIVNFNVDNATDSFDCKAKIISQIGNNSVIFGELLKCL